MNDLMRRFKEDKVILKVTSEVAYDELAGVFSKYFDDDWYTKRNTITLGCMNPCFEYDSRYGVTYGDIDSFVINNREVVEYKVGMCEENAMPELKAGMVITVGSSRYLLAIVNGNLQGLSLDSKWLNLDATSNLKSINAIYDSKYNGSLYYILHDTNEGSLIWEREELPKTPFKMYRIGLAPYTKEVVCNICHSAGEIKKDCNECGGKGRHKKTFYQTIVLRQETIIKVDKDECGIKRFWTESNTYMSEDKKRFFDKFVDAQAECDRLNAEGVV
jgi:hypothetical protein